MDSLHVEKLNGEWVASIVGEEIVGRGDTELDAVKSLARGLQNRLQKIRDAVHEGG